VQIEAQEFLKIAEQAGKVALVDIEATGLKGDYNSVLVVTVKPYGEKCITTAVDRPGDDRKLVVAARDLLHEYPLWVSYYGKGFDIPMIQTRLLRHGARPLVKALHLDLYWHLKAHIITARRSQAHYLRWMDAPSQKMDMSPEEWNLVLANPKKALVRMRQRCESDCEGLEALYDRTKHLIVNITR